jgi:hypothetical protein
LQAKQLFCFSKGSLRDAIVKPRPDIRARILISRSAAATRGNSCAACAGQRSDEYATSIQ